MVTRLEKLEEGPEAKCLYQGAKYWKIVPTDPVSFTLKLTVNHHLNYLSVTDVKLLYSYAHKDNHFHGNIYGC